MIREVSPHQMESEGGGLVPTPLRAPTADPYAVIDGAGTVLAVNDSFVAETGLAASAAVGRPLDEAFALPADVDLGDLLVGVRRDGVATVEAGVGPSGQAHGLNVFVQAATGDGGAPTFGVGFRAVATRRAESTAVALPIERLTVGVTVYGLDGTVRQVNEAMCRLYGRTRDEIPTCDTVLLHPDDRVRAIELGMAAYCGEIEGWTRDKRILRPDGEVRWLEETVALVRDAGGAPAYFISQNLDITVARRSEEALREKEAEVRFLTDGLPIALIEIDADGCVVNGNTAADDLYGGPVVGALLPDLIHRDDLGRVLRAFFSPDGDRDRQIEFRIRRRDGQFRWARVNCRMHVDAEGRYAKAVASVADITDEVEARESSARLSELLESVEDIVLIADDEGTVTYHNATGRWLLGDGSSEDDAGVGRHLTELFAAESAAELNEVALPTVRHFGSWTGEASIMAPGMEPRIVLLSLVSHLDSGSGQSSISAMTRDITELKRAEEAMRRQATTDVLTGLPNRAILFDRLTHALARTNRNGGGVALLFVDLDHFKSVNDQMGHDAGDEVLVEVGRRLSDAVRECDTIARIGGDEFVVLAEPLIRFEDAMVVANRIVTALAEPFTLRAGVAKIGASVGLAMSDREATSRTLLKQADTAVYRAKAAGRSCVVAYDQ
jgi:diguanylate cyclase (GGDEF)-like protein/PAS domain S-box-containing protein